MNAVERLLAHVEQIVSLFDEMCREVDTQDHPEWLVGKTPSAFVEPPRNHHWYIDHWWKVASVASDYDAAQASEMLRGRLAKRERLLDHATLHALVADVVRECRAWDFLAEDVVRAAEAVADNALDIERLSREWFPSLVGYEWQSRRDAYVLHNIGMLRRLAQPQAVAGSGSENQPGSSRGRGGRPPNDEALARDLLDGWRAYEPEEGRKTKDRYLAQRPEVRTLKTPEARQRQIASLLVALNSALHLHREKTKQKRRARG